MVIRKSKKKVIAVEIVKEKVNVSPFSSVVRSACASEDSAHSVRIFKQEQQDIRKDG